MFNRIMVSAFLYTVVAILILGSYPVHAQNTVAVRYLLSALNQERTSRGITPVRLDAALTQVAVAHAHLMADHGSISHRFSGELNLSARNSAVGAHFDRITENVAEGPTAVALHDAWMHSPGHRANILDRAVDAVGIAVVERSGQLYAVQDFQRTVDNLALDQQEAAVGILLDRAGLELIPGADARLTCAMLLDMPAHNNPAS
ncbi:MAG: CAP domain-containing protein [Granulicella sp.]